MPVSGESPSRNPTQNEVKAKKPSRLRKIRFNNEGPCPNRSCKHPPTDHRKIKHTQDYFCYGKSCMDECRPGVRKNG